MSHLIQIKLRDVLIVATLLSLPVIVLADEANDDLKAKVELLESQLNELRQSLEAVKDQAANKQEIGELKQQVAEEVTALKSDVAGAAEWKNPNSLIHMAGYADVGYENQEKADGNFNVGTFAPIFHFQYRDLFLLESELELEVEDDGSTEVALEYLTIDYFLNDYAAIVAGKFLSPVGQFRQNLHPSWINKMASAPPGFGHDGAAPVSDLGVQVRGGFPLGDMFVNYAAYASNGPELIATEEEEEFELEGIDAEGFGADLDGDKTFGGRIGFLPFNGLEVGVSAAFGEASVTRIEGGHEAEEEEEHEAEVASISGTPFSRTLNVGGGEEAEAAGLTGEPGRDYEVFGFDFAWFPMRDLALRGEYVRSEVGADTTGVTASEGATWKTWYSQASYRLPNTNWEPVVRFADFDSPHASEDQEQWALGLNYLFAPNLIAKVNYEFNDGQNDASADSNRWLIQLAYGF